MKRILVIGIGNPDRGDDGVGAAVAGMLADRLPDGVGLAARSGDMLSMIDQWAGFDALVCIDAAAQMGTPGRIHRLDLANEELPRDLAFASSHALGLADAVALARALGCAPARIVVYAVEGCAFDSGVPMTAEVAAAASEVTDRVVAEVGRLRQHCPGLAVHA